jgi:hypothetical protein
MRAHHIRLRPKGSWVIADSTAARRLVVRAVLDRGAAAGLLAFGLADNHLHIEAACDRSTAGRFARHVEVSLGNSLGFERGFESAWIDPVADTIHLARLFEYVLRQPERHAPGTDPLCEGTALPDLLGMRPRGRYVAANVKRWLPRTTRADLLRLQGVSDLRPSAGPLESLVEAGLAASALPDMRGMDRQRQELRAALIAVADRRLSVRALAGDLLCSERTIYRLGQATADSKLVTAVSLQLDLRCRKSDIALAS